MTDAITPTLHLNVGVLKNPTDILSYILRHYLYVPSGIYENYINEEVSFSKAFAEFSSNIEYLKEKITSDLTNILQRYFENNESIVDIVSTNIDDKAVELSIDLQVLKDGKSYSVSPSITIDNATNKFEIKFSDI